MGACIQEQCVIENKGESGNVQPTIDRRDSTYWDRVVMEKEIPQPKYKSLGEMGVHALAAMVDSMLREIIVLGGAKMAWRGTVWL